MMTADLAKRIAADFLGHTLEGFAIKEYHQRGGTSVILLDDTKTVAIKVYDKELTQGSDSGQVKAELERISRQLAMKDHGHPNIVKTRSSGRCNRTGYDYIIMDYIPDPSLEDVLQDIDRGQIRCIIKQVARAALFLHQSLGHVHRDIKPSNIAIRLSDHQVTLLDLGLVRPITGETATDQGVARFVGSKRYAPPEFLDGSMTRDANGWLAVTYYQLGGILFNLIMRKRLYDEYTDEEGLRRAVREQIPYCDASDVPADLVQLARDCLHKDASLRLSLVSWDRFLSNPSNEPSASGIDRLTKLVERIPIEDPLANSYPRAAQEEHARESALLMVNRAIEYHLRNILRSNSALYPRPTINAITISPTSFAFSVNITYGHAEAAQSVTLFITCELIDVASLVCHCDLIACTGAQDDVPEQASRLSVVRGSFVDRVFAAKLENALPVAVAGLLDRQSDGQTVTEPSNNEART
jgi:eukaryotic-like serine/threonine-protein kinase